VKNRSEKNELIEKIAARLRCSSCGRRYRPYDFEILEEREKLSVLRVVCRECHKHSLVLAVIRRQTVQPVFSELEPAEWLEFSNASPISPDAVIEMHRQLQVYEGDFSDVLEDKLPPDARE
jgi:hypothetical protein